MATKIKRLKKGSFKHNEEDPAPMIRHLMSKLVRKEELEGRDYLVCPTVLICEGVHNNVLYTKDDISKFPEAWNGRPVVKWHPEVNGKPVSAASPTVLKQSTLGMLYNTKYKTGLQGGAGLVSEVWLDVKKTEKLAPEILKMLENNEGIEVSTGLFTDDEEPKLNEANDWNGETFTCIARNYRPDHLALLPGGKGACSWDDGAGMPRLNRQEEETCRFHINDKSLFQQADEIRSQVQAQVFPSQEPGSINSGYISDIYDEYAIFRKDGKMFRVDYDVDVEGGVDVDMGSMVEVEQEVTYVPKNNDPEIDQTDDDEEDDEEDSLHALAGEGNPYRGEDGKYTSGEGGGGKGGEKKSSAVPFEKGDVISRQDMYSRSPQMVDRMDYIEATLEDGSIWHSFGAKGSFKNTGKSVKAAKKPPVTDQVMAWAKKEGVTGASTLAAVGKQLKKGKTLDEAVAHVAKKEEARYRNQLGNDLYEQMKSEGKLSHAKWGKKSFMDMGHLDKPPSFAAEDRRQRDRMRNNATLPSLEEVKKLLPSGAKLIRFGTTSAVYMAPDGVKQSMRLGRDEDGELVKANGGAGSGNFGHSGREGVVGGSGDSGGRNNNLELQ